MDEKMGVPTPFQWHPAFFAGIQIEFAEETMYLMFENEHQLGTKPKEIDVLIIKKDSNVPIKKNIGRIFRKYNIIEYKSPGDYLSIDDFFKVYAYACFYKSDGKKVNEIKANEITITFVTESYPRKVLEYLEEEYHYRIQKQEAGIYYMEALYFPIQFLVISQLKDENNFWLHHLTNHLTDRADAKRLLMEYEKHKESNLHKSVMDMIVRANQKLFKEDEQMCDALLELMQDELDARESKGETNKLKELIKKKLQKGKTLEQIADDLEESVEVIQKLIQEMEQRG